MVQRLAADLAASRAIASCSLALDWPMNSPSHRGPQLEFKTLLFVGARRAHQTFRSVVAGDGHAEGKSNGLGLPVQPEEAWDEALLGRQANHAGH
jgi:hypothetical protein